MSGRDGFHARPVPPLCAARSHCPFIQRSSACTSVAPTPCFSGGGPSDEPGQCPDSPDARPLGWHRPVSASLAGGKARERRRVPAAAAYWGGGKGHGVPRILDEPASFRAQRQGTSSAEHQRLDGQLTAAAIGPKPSDNLFCSARERRAMAVDQPGWRSRNPAGQRVSLSFPGDRQVRGGLFSGQSLLENRETKRCPCYCEKSKTKKKGKLLGGKACSSRRHKAVDWQRQRLHRNTDQAGNQAARAANT